MSKAHLFVNDVSNFSELESNPASFLIGISQIMAELQSQVDYEYKSSANINKSGLREIKSCTAHTLYQ